MAKSKKAEKPITNIEPIKCEVVATYKDKNTKRVYNVGDLVEYLEQRASELITSKFIKRLS